MPMLWLASASPRRAQLLTQAGIPFQQLPPPDIDENPRVNEDAHAYVLRMAEEKAVAGWGALAAAEMTHAVVLGGDTAVIQGHQILGKPTSKAQAFEMLSALSGAEHQVVSAVSLKSATTQLCEISVTRVIFRQLAKRDIERYLVTGEGLDKAGSYAIQGYGALLVERIEGSYSGVVGLPLETLFPLLERMAVPYWQTSNN